HLPTQHANGPTHTCYHPPSRAQTTKSPGFTAQTSYTLLFLMIRPPAKSTLFPYTTLFRSNRGQSGLETYGLFSNLTHDFLPISGRTASDSDSNPRSFKMSTRESLP